MSPDGILGVLQLLTSFFASSSLALQSLRDNKQATLVINFLSLFDKPFSDLSKKIKKGDWMLSCEDRAFCVVCDEIVAAAGPPRE